MSLTGDMNYPGGLAAGFPSEFIAQVVFWLDRSKKYGYGNQNESEHIISVVKELWKSFKDNHPALSDDEQLYVEILEEDYGLKS